MPDLSSIQIPPPKNWQDFENICCDVFQKIWNDPNTQKNGRQGQPQNGVDIYGQFNQKKIWYGAQCKGKDNYENNTVTDAEVKEEIEKAKKFKPKLSSFSMVTTGKKDAKIQEIVRSLTDLHMEQNLFSVHVLFWEDIHIHLAGNIDLVKKYYPHLFQITDGIEKKIDEIKNIINAEKIGEQDKTENYFQINIQDNRSQYVFKDIVPDILNTEFQSELDHAKELIEKNKPLQALENLNNLKERAWNNSSDLVKFRIQTNIAASKLALNKNNEAARLFIDALQYNPDEEKSLCNASLGYLILNELELARNSVAKTIQRYPLSERAHSILIQLSPKEKSIDKLISEIPISLQSNPEILYALARLARDRGLSEKYEEFLELAVESDKTDSIDLRAELATVLLDNISKDKIIVLSYNVGSQENDKIDRSLQYLTQAWNAVKNTDMCTYRVGWIFNRGLANKVKGNTDAAIKDLEEALSIEPENMSFLKHYAMLLLEADRNDESINCLKKIISKDGSDDSYTLLAEALRKVNRQAEAIELINKFFSDRPESEWKDEARRLLVVLYLDLNNLEKANEQISILKTKQPITISNIVVEIIASRAQGETNKATDLSQQAKILIDEKTSFRDILELANQFYFLDDYDEAEKLYVNIVDKNSDNLISRRLAICLYELGKRGELFELCDSVSKSTGLTRFFTDISLSAYDEMGDLVRAKEICIEYLEKYPDDIEIQSHKAIIDLRSGANADLEKFLSSPIDYGQVSLQAGMRIAFLFSSKNREAESIKIMYELRRKHFNNPESHLKYVGLFFGNENRLVQWLKLDQISVDTAVAVKFNSDQIEWFILEERSDIDFAKHEISLEHPVALKLIDRKVGDEIEIKRNSLTEDNGKIIEIKSKYLYALHESISKFGRMFPDVPGIWTIQQKKIQNKDNIQEDFDVFFQHVQKRQLTITQIENLYLDGKLTIGSISNILSIDPLEVMAGLIRKPELGLRCCLGSESERQEADNLFNLNKISLVLDIIALLTLHNIDCIAELKKSDLKLIVTQSTIDLLNEMIHDRIRLKDKGYMIIGYENNSYFKQEISKEDRKKGIEFLENIKKWIESECDILPVSDSINFDRNYQLELNRMFGKPWIDSILVAKEEGRLLYTDDERLRTLAKGEFEVNGIWTHIILYKLLNSNFISSEKYNSLIIKLAKLNYRHTSINSDTLIEAAKQSNWLPLEPFESVIRMLNGSNSDIDSATVVSCNFLFNLWTYPISIDKRIYFLIKLLGEIVKGRNKQIVISTLSTHVINKFNLLPLAKDEILKIIDIWKLF